MITVHGHSFDENVTEPGDYVLDLGCRGFEFSESLTRMGYDVRCVDADKLNGVYLLYAVLNSIRKCSIIPNGLGTKVIPGNNIQGVTIDWLSGHFNIMCWGLIKMDIEGSEYEVIMSLKSPPAKQLSIEFHRDIYGKPSIDECVEHLEGLGYITAQHEPTANGNYYDSVFILKEYANTKQTQQ